MTVADTTAQLLIDQGLAHQIVHGTSTQTVTTEGGSVKTMAKMLADNDVLASTAETARAAQFATLQAQRTSGFAITQSQGLTARALADRAFARASTPITLQDLTSVSLKGLHRSPTAIVQTLVYDTSSDSDPTWPDRVTNTSWFNETLSGNWITAPDARGIQSEVHARCSGSTLGAELLVNGTFDTGITGWDTSLTSPPGTVTWDSVKQCAKLTRVTGNNARLDQSVTTVAGVLYRVTVTVDTNCSVICGTAQGGTQYVNVSGIGWGQLEFFFTATTTVAWIRILNSVDGVLNVDNVSIKAVTALSSRANDYYQLGTDGKFYKLNRNVSNATEDFTSGSWTKTNLTVTADVSLSPTGTLTMDKLIPTAANVQHFALRNTSGLPLSATAITLVIHLKPAEYTKAFVYMDDSAGNSAAWSVDLTTGTTTPTRVAHPMWTNLSITTTAVANGSWKVAISGNATPSTNTLGFRFGPDPATTYDVFGHPNAFLANGTDGIYAWGFALNYGVDSTYEAKQAADLGVTEVFRGGKAKAPRLMGLVAETARLVIYDLLEPGRPMWRSYPLQVGVNATSGVSISGIAGGQGIIAIAATAGSVSLRMMDLIKDRAIGMMSSSGGGGARTWDRALDHTLHTSSGGIPTPLSLASATVTAVAITTKIDAPVDPVTSLQVPTIAASHTLGVTVLKHDGTVANPTLATTGTMGKCGWLTSGHLFVSPISGATAWRASLLSPDLASVQTYSYYSTDSSIGPTFTNSPNAEGAISAATSPYCVATVTGAGTFAMARPNPSTQMGTLMARITGSYNTGWTIGDCRRLLACDTGEGSIIGALITGDNSTFTSSAGSWTPSTNTATATGGVLVISGSTNPYAGLNVTVVPGQSYKLTFDITAKTAGVTDIGTRAGNVASVFGGAQLFQLSGLTTGTGQTVTFTATTTVAFIQFLSTANTVGDSFSIDNVTLAQVVVDRSYKVKQSTVFGTLTKTAVATGSQLVAYSGFSGANYIQEPYSSDLDVGAGAWRMRAWAATSNTYGAHNIVTAPEDLTAAAWVKNAAGVTIVANATTAPNGGVTSDKIVEGTGAAPSSFGWTVLGGGGSISTMPPGRTAVVAISAKPAGRTQIAVGVSLGAIATAVIVDLTTKTVVGSVNVSSGNFSSSLISAVDEANGNVRISVLITALSGIGAPQVFLAPALGGTVVYIGDGSSGVYVTNVSFNRGSTAFTYRPGLSAAYDEIMPIVHRGFSSGAYYQLGVDGTGAWSVEAFDGTTTRRASGTAFSAGYGVFQSVIGEYTTNGTLAIKVNGQQVAQTAGAALLTLNNASAALTIGNNFALTAPFIGSIALVKFGVTLPTADQTIFCYEQEKMMFQPGAQVALPDTGPLIDLGYDDRRGVMLMASSLNESTYLGLVRVTTVNNQVGSITKTSGTYGAKLMARSTTNPGVDVTIPAYVAREETLKRAEDANRMFRVQRAFDFDAITAQTDFTLPAGWETSEVISAGASKREGSTKDWIRVYDGFHETVRFITAPGNGVWVQIIARRIVT